MPDDFPRDRPHLFLPENGRAEPYRRPKQIMPAKPFPIRDRAAHAAALEFAVGSAIAAARDQLSRRDPAVVASTSGFYLEIEVPRDERGVVDQLANSRQKMEVVAVREPSEPDAPLFASVFVPVQAENYYLRKIEAYRTTDTTTGRPRNEALISRIDTVRLATIRSLFTDGQDLFPRDEHERVWWEVWLRDGRRELFEHTARALNIEIKPAAIHFPEREVLLALSDAATLGRVIAHSDVIAELRRAKDTPAFFIGLNGAQQRTLSDDVLRRVQAPEGTNVAVCLLDSGITRTHPLIAPALDQSDCHTINPAWSTNDTPHWQGHGTRMAGLTLYGDLVPVLVAKQAINLPYRLESVRILPPAEDPPNNPLLYGAITAEAVARAEVQAPRRRRAVAMAVSSTSATRGRPSSWSAAIDLCFDTNNRRLVILSAGNIRDDITPADYLSRNDLETIDDPAQAWNALTVGAFTDKIEIFDPSYGGYTPIAPAGELSPRSRTSVTWGRQWPVKPDVTLEGGNLAHNGRAPGEDIDDLQLLTTYYRPQNRHFTTFGDTSAATALVARMAGSILAVHPQLCPETVRGLIVHSAEWTPAMQTRIDDCNGSKTRIQALVRRYGYGVPDLGRALWSARNDLTLMSEDELRPFQRAGKSEPTTRDMKLHQLPWPRAELAALGATPVELRVTLSYFIEPNPGERGWTRRHRYASYGLRFRVKSATEALDEFRARINQAAREEDEGAPAGAGTGAEEWLLGTFRDSGSIHSDIWRGTAADLAERDAIGVFPIGGWWKEKPFLERYSESARYSLIVTIRAPGVDVDIYTPVENQVVVPIEIET